MLANASGASDLPGLVEDLASKLVEARDEVSSISGLEVETVRIVVEGDIAGFLGERLRLAELVDDYGILLSAGAVPLEIVSREPDEFRSLLETGLFFNIILPERTWEHAREASRFIHYVAEADPSLATLFGVNVYGEPLATPYYPLASTAGGPTRLAVALTYPNYLARAYEKGGVEEMRSAIRVAGESAVSAGRLAAERVGVPFAGVDLSVAPWMRESSLGLVELVAGVRMPEPGFLLGVRTVNRVLGEVAGEIENIGFNEVQLPVAEDLKMKARVSELDTSARDLARFTCVCLAGLDLAVVPASIDGVAGLILDTGACSEAKGRVLGVRIIPVEDVEPGDRVWLDKFGETPVIPI